MTRGNFFEATGLFEAFPIWEHLVQKASDNDEWLSSEEALHEVTRMHRKVRSKKRAALWLLEAWARGHVIVDGGGAALAYRAAGYAGIWKSSVFQRGPLWSLSSLEAALPGASEKKSGGKLGRTEKDFWRHVPFEAGAWLGLAWLGLAWLGLAWLARGRERKGDAEQARRFPSDQGASVWGQSWELAGTKPRGGDASAFPPHEGRRSARRIAPAESDNSISD